MAFKPKHKEVELDLADHPRFCMFHWENPSPARFIEIKEAPDWIKPEINLISAVLQQALIDLQYQPVRANALDWLTQEAGEDEEFTLPWICSQLGVDFSLMKKKVNEIIEVTKNA